MTKPHQKDKPQPYKKDKGKPYFRDKELLGKFGGRLKQLRLVAGLSQEQLANELGFSQSHLANIELGNVNTSISHAAAIAKALGVKTKDLFDF